MTAKKKTAKCSGKAHAPGINGIPVDITMTGGVDWSASTTAISDTLCVPIAAKAKSKRSRRADAVAMAEMMEAGAFRIPEPAPVRLNLGAGATVIEGFTAIDRKLGTEAYPLNYPDGSVDEIRAAHVLEHFNHPEAATVLKHWVAKLAPGGLIRIAVPNFQWIAENYLAGKNFPVQGFTMGGHLDANDRHGCIFDAEALQEMMIDAGLERIGVWKSEITDTASLPVSLNLQGFKPSSAENEVKGVVAILSAPRFGPVMHFATAVRAFNPLRIDYQVGQGAYWHQVLSEQLESCIASGAEFILTLDYDTVFAAQDVLELYRLMRACPEVDACCAVQMRRGEQHALFTMKDAEGKTRGAVGKHEFNRNLTRVYTGHFGLTLFRASSLNSLQRPWMRGIPDKDGRWGEKKCDPDVEFWVNWNESGRNLHMANRVVVGHIVEVASWPGPNFEPVYQPLQEYRTHGIPANVVRVAKPKPVHTEANP